MANSSKQEGLSKPTKVRPPQQQSRQPGRQYEMTPQPVALPDWWKGGSRLLDKKVLITGGDSGIGRSASVAMAREGADVSIIYLEEDTDAEETKRLVEAEGRRCLLLRGDIGSARFCERAVKQVVAKFGALDVLVNNAAEQHPQPDIEEIDEKQLVQTFRTNIFSMFFLVKAALPHLREATGASIINTTSVTAYRGSPGLLDYSATKGAIVSFTRSLSQQLAKDKIRVNAVAPGPIWTPLIPSTFPKEKVEKFGTDVPMGRAGEPWECAGAYVFLASEESSYITGQVIHPNGGEIING